jgi:hypothetical protein
MKPKVTIDGLSWNDIENLYDGMRQRDYEAEAERAVLLLKLRHTEAWKERSRYAVQAVFAQYSAMSWAEIVVERLGESLLEVENTIKTLEEFGYDRYRKYGRESLLRVHHRGLDEATKAKVFAAAAERAVQLKRPLAPNTFFRILDEISPPGRPDNRADIEAATSMVTKLREKNRKLKEENQRLKRTVVDLENRVTTLRGLVSSCPRCSRANKAKQFVAYPA